MYFVDNGKEIIAENVLKELILIAMDFAFLLMINAKLLILQTVIA
jgi:hypothetical protein